MNIRDRAIGSLIGLAIGDALGMQIEFSIRDTVPPVIGMNAGGPFKLNAGEWTDDTSMALCLAESLIECNGLDQKNLMDKFNNWYSNGYNSHNGICFDIGNATRNAMMLYRIRGNPVSGSTSENSAGNGSIMRLSPVAIRYWNDKNAAKEAAIAQSVTTHGNIECINTCKKMTEVLVDLINNGDVKYLPKNKYWKTIGRQTISSSGYVISTWEAGQWAVANTDNFKDAVLLAVNLGDDSDTVGAVAGQIAGALYGYSSIPKEWLDVLAWHDKIYNLAETLYNVGV
jgi:ADP-ribosyl-[dinitrogen reductase] hydrolase